MPSQARQLCELILGCGSLPEPEREWAAFRSAVMVALSSAPSTVDPRSGRRAPWIAMSRLGAITGRSILCDMLCDGGLRCAVL